MAGHTHTFKENKKRVFMKLLLISLGNLFKSSSNDTSWYLIAAPNFCGWRAIFPAKNRSKKISQPCPCYLVERHPCGGHRRIPPRPGEETEGPSEWRFNVHFRGTNPPPWKTVSSRWRLVAARPLHKKWKKTFCFYPLFFIVAGGPKVHCYLSSFFSFTALQTKNGGNRKTKKLLNVFWCKW